MIAVSRHAFVPDDTAATWDGKPGCGACPLPEQHEVHHLPDVPADVTAAEARRLGEREHESDNNL